MSVIPPEGRREALMALLSAPGTILATTPILVPALPYFELAGEEFGANLVLADDDALCLRPDFTLPLAMTHLESGAGTPAGYGYLGPVFRRRAEGPAEFDQAGIELLAFPDADAALDRVVAFARAALDLYGVTRPHLRVGGVDLFEALLEASDMPAVWRPRIRARFGHPEAMARLLDRLADPHAPAHAPAPRDLGEADLADWVRELMFSSGMSLTEGRAPEEVARRYLEKQALEAAHVPAATVALLKDYLAISGEADAALARVGALAGAAGLDLSAALARLAARLGQLRNGGRLEALVFDAGFSPRLDYYTGIVFELRHGTGPVLASGGQYDRLLRRLGAPRDVPAVGCAVWVERLEEAAP